jgi:hypothetical protein
MLEVQIKQLQLSLPSARPAGNSSSDSSWQLQTNAGVASGSENDRTIKVVNLLQLATFWKKVKSKEVHLITIELI